MRKDFNSTPRTKIKNLLEANLGVMLAVGLPVSFAAATMIVPDVVRSENPRVPDWAAEFEASPRGDICTIKDLKTGEEFISENGAHVRMARGFSVASSPSSCNVTAPDKSKTCQLRGWPIEPIC